jgi:antirestriction protein ArdC
LQEVKEGLKSPRDWVRNFTKQGRKSPLNPVNSHEYKAFNLVALSAASDKAGYSDPRWLTADQAEKAYGAKLKEGATPTSIAVPTLREYQTEDGVSRESVRFAPVQVYNAEQFNGMPKYEEPETVKYTPAEAFQVILDRFNRAEIERKGRGIPGILGLKVDGFSINPDNKRPFKGPNYSKDRIKLPLREQFKSDEAWIQSLAHELIHSTGVAFRQNRPETQQAATDRTQRAKEEAIAEMASAMLIKMFGLNYDTKNSAAYIKVEAREGQFTDEDLTDISIKAQAAIDYMLGNDIDTMPKWDPSQTKRPKTPTELRNTELTPLASSVNPDTSQASIDSLDLVEVSLDQDVSSSDQAKQKVYDALVKKLEELGSKTIPWRKGYKDGFEFTGGSGLPRNPASKRLYSGFNSFWLKIAAMSADYTDSRWMTYKQAQDLGGNVRKGEKGIPILVPVKFLVTKDKKGNPIVDKDGKPAGFAKLYFKTATVFNVAQIDGLNLPDDKPTTEMAPVDAQEFILGRYLKSMEAKGLKAPKIDYSYVGNYSNHDSSPNWSPFADSITLPSMAQFNSPEEVFDTLMHELTHSTGHPSRLDRTELLRNYGNPDGQARAQEELIAEMGSAILGEMFGVKYDVDNTQAYMQSWFNVLKGGNPEILQLSASKAQQAVDYMLGIDLGDWSPLEGYNTYLGKQGQEGDEE